MEKTKNSKKNFLILLVAFILSFSLVSALYLEGHANPYVEMLRGKKLVGGPEEMIDGDLETFVTTSYGRADGYRSELVGRVAFEEPRDLDEISYKRYLKNGGSKYYRYCYEKLFIQYNNGTWEEIYYKNWNSKTFTDLDEITVEGNWDDVVEIKLHLYAGVGGHTSGNELRIYEIWATGDFPKDLDNDGYSNEVDCDDSDDSVWQLIEGYVDSDLDGKGTGDASNICSGNQLPEGFSEESGDCDDSNPNIFPGATESCETNYDDNCNGVVNEECAIACYSNTDCGVPVCAGGPNYCSEGDVWQVFTFPTCENPGEYNAKCSSYDAPWLIQKCEFECVLGVCLGEPDIDLDDDGYNNTVDCNDTNASINPGIVESCNGIDDNCDGQIDEGCSTEDTTPPASVSDLNSNDRGEKWIRWTWTNPSDDDFSQAIIYLNGKNVLNTSNTYYKATSLDEDEKYTILIHTMDTSGNINLTNITYIEWTLEEDDDDDDGKSGSSFNEVKFYNTQSNEETSDIKPVILNSGASKTVAKNSPGINIWTIVISLLIIAIIIILLVIFGII